MHTGVYRLHQRVLVRRCYSLDHDRHTLEDGDALRDSHKDVLHAHDDDCQRDIYLQGSLNDRRCSYADQYKDQDDSDSLDADDRLHLDSHQDCDGNGDRDCDQEALVN